VLGQITAAGWGWAVFGAAAWLCFYTRFYVQWIVSEIRGRSVVPIAFWYQSAVGSVMLLVWAVYTQSPLGAIGQCTNLVPYSRNLIHIWRERGALSRGRSIATHAVAGVVVIAGIIIVGFTWWVEYANNRQAPASEARQAWFWLAIGLVGQGLFATRFLVQWLVTEYRRKSVMPAAFWYISIVAAALQVVTFVARGGGELLYAFGLLATALIYARNIWFIRTGRGDRTLAK
jgi:lipid-A-disaccharide synthase-like uncharacterized protein